jgi:hypothetical protein
MRVVALLLICLSLSGCLAVIGYEPTPEELEALRRGEDPRAHETEDAQVSVPEHRHRTTREGGQPPASTNPEPAPHTGIVLRWKDSATLVIEAAGAAEVVALAGEQPSRDRDTEQRALNRRMNEWTYGMTVNLRYPTRDASGAVIYRDAQGQLVAAID